MCLAKPFRTCSSFHSAFALTQRATQPSLPPAFESSRADQFMKLKIYRQRIKYFLNDFSWIKFISVSLTKLFLSLTRQYLPFSEKTDQLDEKIFLQAFNLPLAFGEQRRNDRTITYISHANYSFKAFHWKH